MSFCHFSFLISHTTVQDSLARAVADEMQKVYKEELGPEPVPLTVVGQAVDEEDVSRLSFCCIAFIVNKTPLIRLLEDDLM